MASSSLSPLSSINVADGQRNSRSFTMLHTLHSITTCAFAVVLCKNIRFSMFLRLQLRQGQKANQKTAGIQLSSSSGRSIHNVSARRTRSEGNTSCQSLEKKITSVATPKLDVITAMVNGKMSISSLRLSVVDMATSVRIFEIGKVQPNFCKNHLGIRI